MTRQLRTQHWEPGDLFAIPLSDGRYLPGQVLAVEPEVLNSVSCALFAEPTSELDGVTARASAPVAVLFVTRDLLDKGTWPVIGRAPLIVARECFPFEQLRDAGFVGARVVGSRNVAEFANALCGLVPWDDWADPHYLDTLLVSPDRKPKGVIYKARR